MNTTLTIEKMIDLTLTYQPASVLSLRPKNSIAAIFANRLFIQTQPFGSLTGTIRGIAFMRTMRLRLLTRGQLLQRRSNPLKSRSRPLVSQ